MYFMIDSGPIEKYVVFNFTESKQKFVKKEKK